MLQSLLAEIFGAVPAPQAGSVARVAPDKRALVIFEDNLAPVRKWQTDLLKVDQDALREMDTVVLCIAADGEPSMVNGQPQALPVADLRRELQADGGKFELFLVERDGTVILRSDVPLTVADLKKALSATSGEKKGFERSAIDATREEET
ncbi:hypothetical protein REJC140_03041 [Pseudorhizobium endolithicum]|uniref:DUF4174 domain-containing protein n=1 Tax=Pseudorhizobium endolithicum TaxID=1191678 RepID=A0ABN7JNS6_9HYPH|nr:DUF4174 domain-containing protein [Pseudorhizobium endolithicum]CAD6417532.1 hypothetical protein REQ54_01720 [Rhizobium sp. Q54]CAD7032344.1 hypothetical protein REJC140_03041 [Pseudorhizobium endolithicum]